MQVCRVTSVAAVAKSSTVEASLARIFAIRLAQQERMRKAIDYVTNRINAETRVSL